MKTRMFAIALERGRVGERRAQACGFVSRTMARSEGGGPVAISDQSLINGTYRCPPTLNRTLVMI